MRNKTILLSAVIIALFAAVSISGCKKPDDTPSHCTNGVKDGDETGVDCGGSCSACTGIVPVIKTRTYVSPISGTTTYYYTYDSQQRVTSISGVGSIAWDETYTYATHTVTVVHIDNGTLISTYTYTLNSAGLATSLVVKDTANNIESTDAFTYDADGHLLTTAQGYSFTWTNGNLTERNGNGWDETYTYNTNKTNTAGNANTGQSFLGKSSQNLINSYTASGGVPVTYSYQYDSQNRITQQTDGAITENYTYY